MRSRELAAAGMPDAEARARARQEFGSVTRVQEDSRATWIARGWGDLLQNPRDRRLLDDLWHRKLRAVPHAARGRAMAARRKEVATRVAIGAGRGRLVRQLLTESVLLALLGGAGGYAIVYAGASSIGNFKLPFALPIDFSVALDYRVLLFCVALSVATGVVFGLVPALRASRLELTAALKQEQVRLGGSGEHALVRMISTNQMVTATSMCA